METGPRSGLKPPNSHIGIASVSRQFRGGGNFGGFFGGLGGKADFRYEHEVCWEGCLKTWLCFCHFSHALLKFIFDLVCFVRFHLFPFGTLSAGTATADAPAAWAGKLTYFYTWTFAVFHSRLRNPMKSKVNLQLFSHSPLGG